jgi:polyferredoxin
MNASRRFYFALKKFITPAVIVGALGVPAVIAWRTAGHVSPLFILGYLGASAGVGIALYALLPRDERIWGRRLVIFVLGTSLFGVATLRDPAHMLFQIEGLFFDLLAGVLLAGVLHYLIAKVIGPLLFGRIWCGWACWTAMILDQLPYKRSDGRIPGWGWARYAHFGLSLGLVALLWYGLHIRPGAGAGAALAWFLGGNALYYLLGISMAFALKDNRAFCKYACPVAVPLKLTSGFALLKIQGDKTKCDQGGQCIKICPMDVRVTDYVQSNGRVLSTECILCQACINACPQEALSLSFGFDCGNDGLLRSDALERN